MEGKGGDPLQVIGRATTIDDIQLHSDEDIETGAQYGVESSDEEGASTEVNYQVEQQLTGSAQHEIETGAQFGVELSDEEDASKEGM